MRRSSSALKSFWGWDELGILGRFTQNFTSRGFREFVSEEGRYLLDVPIHWITKPVSEEYGQTFTGPDGTEGVLSVKSVIIAGQTLEQYCEALQEGVHKEMGYEFVTGSDTQVAQRPAKEMVFFAPAYKGGEKKKAVVHVSVIDNSDDFRFIALGFSVLESEYEKYKAVYERAKRSFRVL